MNKILVLLKSRTVWTIVVLFLVSGVEGIKDMIPVAAQTPVQFILSALAAYFRVNPKAELKAANIEG